jgi:hypothetical protein
VRRERFALSAAGLGRLKGEIMRVVGQQETAGQALVGAQATATEAAAIGPATHPAATRFLVTAHPLIGRKIGFWLKMAAVTLVAALGSAGCAEIAPASVEASARLADRRTELEVTNVLVEYQKKRKTEAQANGENPDKYDDASLLRGEERFERIWKQQRELEFKRFYDRYLKLSGDIVNKCNIVANHADVLAWQIDECSAKLPEAQYDPLRTAGVTFAVFLVMLAGIGLYRQGRRSLDPVALAAPKLGMQAVQGRRSTVLTGSYKGYKLRIESAAPEAGGGDKYVRIDVLDQISPDAIVRFGPVAPPTGLSMPDLAAPEVDDVRIPMGYKLRLSEGAAAEELLSGDVGFQIREFDPVDVRVHDGILTVTTWFTISDAAQAVELVDLSIAVADTYKA